MASGRSILRLAGRSSASPLAAHLRRTPASAARTYASAVARPATDSKSAANAEQGSEDLSSKGEDINMNGNYPDPSLTSALPIKRQFRDPYGEWWDPQERRNYGETVHEDNDVLGIFSPEVYTHFKPGWGGILMGSFIATFGAVCLGVYRYYPDRASAPRIYPGGLEEELGGPRAPRARNAEDDAGAVLER